MKAECRGKSAIEEARHDRFVPSLLVVFQNFSLSPVRQSFNDGGSAHYQLSIVNSLGLSTE
ncbi:MAG: hypothetical protein ABSA83_18745 [Verrucomicrobiota bacterium]